jgi:predicted amidophosphoribosyltransferase
VAILPGLVGAALDAVFPPRCVTRACGRRGAWLCTACLDSVVAVPSSCAVCAGAQCACRVGTAWAFERAIAAGLYEGALRDAVRALKFRAVTPLAEPLGALAADALCRAVVLPAGAVLAPVPGDPARTAARGVDHTLLLAEAAGRTLGLPVRAELLRRTGPSARQVGLAAAERAANVAGAFRVEGVAPPCVVVVDDVLTTGATAQAASSVFRREGAVVFVVVVARSDRAVADADEPRSRLNDRRDAGAPL